MTPKAFTQWLADMRSAGLAMTDRQAAKLLGVHYNAITRYRQKGADQRTALACRALLHRMEPYGPDLQ